jgi:hypothetical protein
MAQKVNIILVDDLDGGSADENVRFGLDGVSYEIDLSSAHAAELRSSLEDIGRPCHPHEGGCGFPQQ